MAEKIADAQSRGEAEPFVPEGEPVETPEDVQAAVAPNSMGSRADTSETDAIVRAAKAMRDGAAPEQAQQATANVCLIVDDSRVIRKVTSKIARSLGYVPIEAQDGLEALARCKRMMPKLVLTDWDMPEMDGLEFVTKLRAIPTPKPPTVVFCTSKGRAADVNLGIKAGADDYIVKPFDEATLRAKLEKLSQG